MRPSILIAGIGNVFLGDDGFGVEVIRTLSAQPLPPHVIAIDYGIRGFDLACALTDDFETVLLVDAIQNNDVPGTLYVIEPKLSADAPTVDPHGLHPQQVLQLAHSLGEIRARILLLGCEPQTFGPPEGLMSLSPPVAAAIPKAIEWIHANISLA